MNCNSNRGIRNTKEESSKNEKEEVKAKTVAKDLNVSADLAQKKDNKNSILKVDNGRETFGDKGSTEEAKTLKE